MALTANSEWDEATIRPPCSGSAINLLCDASSVGRMAVGSYTRYIYPLSKPATTHTRHTKRLRVARRACRATHEGRLCGDVWEYVSYSRQGRITSVRCASHGHRHHWDAGKLLQSLRSEYRTLPRTRRRKIAVTLASFKTKRRPSTGRG